MEYMLRKFRWKLFNPVYCYRARRILYSYNKYALQDPCACGQMIDRLCAAMGETITPQQREACIRYVISLKCDPQNRRDRLRMWSIVNAY